MHRVGAEDVRYAQIAHNQVCKWKKLGFALLIILGIGNLVVAGIAAGSFIHLSRLNANIIIGVCSGFGIVLLTVGILGSVKNICARPSINTPIESEESTEEEIEDVNGAWNTYLRQQNQRQRLYLGERLEQTHWQVLPKEALLNKAMDLWLTTEVDINKKVCVEFIRDCARKYPNFCTKCLTEERLWSCFTGCQEYLIDIAEIHPSFGYQIMTSDKKGDIHLDQVRLGIFRASHQTILDAITENTLSDKEVENLALFLLDYRIVITKKDFQKVQQIKQFLLNARAQYDEFTEEYDSYQSSILMMDLVEGKLSFQGIYSGGAVGFPHIGSELFVEIFQSDWIKEVARTTFAINTNESLHSGLLYLSLIPKTSERYIEAQMAIGYIWQEVEMFAEAAECYLEIVEHQPLGTEDALMLAASCSLSTMKEGDDWVYILRENRQTLIEEGKEVRDLNIVECQSFTFISLKETINRLKN